MCPFDVTMGKAMAYFDMFLPTYDAQRIGKEKTYELWFQEFMSFWDACPNSPPWEPVPSKQYVIGEVESSNALHLLPGLDGSLCSFGGS